MSDTPAILPEAQDLNQDNRQPATVERIQAVIALLLDDRGYEQRAIRAVQFERLKVPEHAQQSSRMLLHGRFRLGEKLLEERNALGATVGWLVEPAMYVRSIPLIEAYSSTAEAFADPDCLSAKRRLRKSTELSQTGFYPADAMKRWDLGGINLGDTLLWRERESRVWRHVAAIRLAMRLYELDHGGKRPLMLGELAPKYLPKVPMDAFGPGNRPYGYFRDGTRSFLHSFGENGVDDMGKNGWKPDWMRTEPWSYQKRDLVYEFERPKRKDKPAPKKENSEE